MLDADVPIGKMGKAFNLAGEHFEEVDVVVINQGDPGGLSVKDLKEMLT